MELHDVFMIHNPTAVHQSWKGHFTRLDIQQVLINRGTYLEVYSLKDEELTIESKLELTSYIQYCAPLSRPKIAEYDFILIITLNCLSVYQWNGEDLVEKTDTISIPEIHNTKLPLRLDSVKSSSVVWISSSEDETESAVVVLQIIHGWVLSIRVDCKPENECVLWIKEINLQSLRPVPVNQRDRIGSNASKMRGPLFWNAAFLIDMEIVLCEMKLTLVLLMKDLDLSWTSSAIVMQCDLSTEDLTVRFHCTFPKLQTDSGALFQKEDVRFPDADEGRCWIVDRSGMVQITPMTVCRLETERSPEKDDNTMDSSPVCCEWVSSGLLIVATATGKFYLLEKQDDPRPLSVEVSGFSTTPKMLTLLQSAGKGHGGVLFVAGDFDRSIFLLTDQSVFSSPVDAWRNLTGRIVFDSLAPIRHMELIPDPSGSAAENLFVCSGEFPFGSLKRCDYSYSVTSVTSAPSRLQSGVTLIPCKEDANDEFHSYLCLSYEAAECSQILSVKEEPFSMIELPGFDFDSYTLLFTTVYDTDLLQVTTREARWLKGECGMINCWTSQERISKASFHGDYLAISSRTTIHLISFEKGHFKLESSKELSQPISFLEFFKMDEMYLAVGEWIVNTVQLFSGTDFTILTILKFPHHQPRSIHLLHCYAENFCFLVGTNTGSIISLKGSIVEGKFSSQSESRICQIGTTEVVFKETLNKKRILASCDQPAVVEDGEDLTVRRLFLGKGNCQSVAFIQLNSLGESVAWVTHDGDFRFGIFQPLLQFHWITLQLSDTPLTFLYHEESVSLLVAATNPKTCVCRLNLVDPRTLDFLGSLALPKGHSIDTMMTMKVPVYDRHNGTFFKETDWENVVLIWTHSSSKDRKSSLSVFKINVDSISTLEKTRKEMILIGMLELDTLVCSSCLVYPKLPTSYTTDPSNVRLKSQQGRFLDCKWDVKWPLIVQGDLKGNLETLFLISTHLAPDSISYQDDVLFSFSEVENASQLSLVSLTSEDNLVVATEFQLSAIAFRFDWWFSEKLVKLKRLFTSDQEEQNPTVEILDHGNVVMVLSKFRICFYLCSHLLSCDEEDDDEKGKQEPRQICSSRQNLPFSGSFSGRLGLSFKEMKEDSVMKSYQKDIMVYLPNGAVCSVNLKEFYSNIGSFVR